MSQLAEQHRIFISCTLPGGRYHPVMLHSFTVVEAKLDIGVTDIDGK